MGDIGLARLIRQYESGRRFWRHVRTAGPNDCWEWLGPSDPDGYGRFDGILAHERAYELANGGTTGPGALEHSCGNRSCVNPRHLEFTPCSG